MSGGYFIAGTDTGVGKTRVTLGLMRLLQARGLSVQVVPWTKGTTPESYAVEVWPRIEAAEPGLVCLCGFLRRLPVKPGWEGRMLNIHPALLPDFGGQGMWGEHVHRAVLAAGVTESGCTIHVVDDEYDRGPIVLQRRVAVYEDDTVETLAARVFEAECEAYPEAIRLFGEGRLNIDGGRVSIS